MPTPSRSIRARTVWGSDHYESVVVGMMRAQVSVWIATANLKELYVAPLGPARQRFHSVLAEFDRLSRAGVELRVLHAGAPSSAFRDTFDAFPRLVAGGLALRQCPRVHMKAVIVDGAWAYVGSANWTGAGLGAKGDGRRNFELGLLTDDETVIDEVQGRFDEIWHGAPCRACRLRAQCEAPLDLPATPRHPAATIVRIAPPGVDASRIARPRRP